MKQFVRFGSCMLALALLLSICIPVYASGSVGYDANAREFIFAPGTYQSPTSLFDNFLNVMPGDILTEEILIKNASNNKVKIKVYMRSLGAQENSDDFLSQMKLTVQQMDDSVLFDAPANQTAQLDDWVYLGTVYSGGEITLDVMLQVPITMGNDFQNKIGYIDWEFKVEEFPIESTDPTPPPTGDQNNVLLYSGILCVSLGGLIVLLLAAVHKRKTDNH